MKLLFFSSYFWPYTSGLTTYPLKLLTYLALKHQVTVLTFSHQANLPSTETYRGIRIIRMPYNLKVSKGYVSYPSLKVFRREIQKHHVLLLNLPNAEGFPLAYLAQRYHRPIIAIYHCQVDLGGSLKSRLINYVLDQSINYQLTQSHYITAYTWDYVDQHPQVNKFRSKIVIVTPPISRLPVDRTFYDQLIKQKKSQIWLGFSGRTAKEKGLEYLISATARLARTRSVKLLFAGPFGSQVAGEEGYYRRLLRQLHDLGLAYQFLGTLKDGELGAFYRSIDLLCLPSVNGTEAFGMVQAEAMLLGAPVVATDLPGVRFPVQKTGMGLIVSPANARKLESAINHIINHRSIYVSDSKVKVAAALFDEKLTFKQYDQLLQKFNAG